MSRILPKEEKNSGLSPEELSEIRRALLLLDREETRGKGRKRLERIAKLKHPILSPMAQSGLASSALWSGDLCQTLYWTRMTIALYPMSPAALWCATLLVATYRTLGMRRERFQAEGDRLRIMKRIALSSDHVRDRIFALHELKKELESRDLEKDARRCSEELQDLMDSEPGDA